MALQKVLAFHEDISWDGFVEELKLINFGSFFPGALVTTRSATNCNDDDDDKIPTFYIDIWEEKESTKHVMFFSVKPPFSIWTSSYLPEICVRMWFEYQHPNDNFSPLNYMETVWRVVQSLINSYFKNPQDWGERIRG